MPVLNKRSIEFEKRRSHVKTTIACVAADSFRGDRTSERKAGERRSTLEWAKKLGRSREGVRKKGEGVGRKGTAVSVRRLTPSPYCLFCHFFAVFLPFTSVWKGERKTAATQASPPPPTAYFATFTQFSSRSRAFGKGKENGCYAG